MGYRDFLHEFSLAQGIEGGVDNLLENYASKYSFQINSRKRAAGMIDLLKKSGYSDFEGKRVLDIGCAYGSYSIALAQEGAHVVGIDISDKWLKLGEINADGDADVKFINCDASSYRAKNILAENGPYDLFIVNDVFEHVFDTVGLMSNISQLASESASIYFKVPNGKSTRHVLEEGHKKIFGISLLAPDYWSHFVSAPFHIYYRRWPYFSSIFGEFGFKRFDNFRKTHDPSRDMTISHIERDIAKIREKLKNKGSEESIQYAYLKREISYYFDEVSDDIKDMDWNELYQKYRVTFWEGLLHNY